MTKTRKKDIAYVKVVVLKVLVAFVLLSYSTVVF